ncbi:MAG: hypothetical protein AAF559_02365 [Pseudomonadota bacterium]
MNSLVRVVGAVAAGCASLACLFFVWFSNDASIFEDSAIQSQKILLEMKTAAGVVTEFQDRTGRLPNEEELESALPKNLKFAPLFFLAAPGQSCTGDQNWPSAQASDKLKICYRRGEWMEAYGPATGEHTLATSVDKCRPHLWLSVAFVLLSSVFGFISWRTARSPVQLTGKA